MEKVQTVFKNASSLDSVALTRLRTHFGEDPIQFRVVRRYLCRIYSLKKATAGRWIRSLASEGFVQFTKPGYLIFILDEGEGLEAREVN